MAEQGEHGDGDEAVVWGSAYPPSINAGIPRLGELPASWSRLRMKDMLEVIERPVKLVDTQTYQLVTAKRSRGGIVSRGTLRGDEIKVKQQFEVRSGDFILSNRQIAHGGCGIVPPELDGAVVSGEYTVLHPKPMLDLRFLHYLSHSAYFQQICFHSGVGVHVEKLVFRLHDWLNWQIDIPPLPEQQRIAEVLADFDSAIEATDTLVIGKQRRKRDLTLEILQSLGANVPRAALKTVSSINALSLPEATDPNFEFEYFPISTDLNEEVDAAGWMTFGQSPSRARRLANPGDAIYSTVRPLLRRCFLAPNNPNAVYSTGYAILGGSKKLDSRFLYHLLTTPDFERQVHARLTGSNYPAISAGDLGEVSVPLPPISKQTETAELLEILDRENELHAKRATLMREQSWGLMQKLLSGDRNHRSLVKEVVAV